MGGRGCIRGRAAGLREAWLSGRLHPREASPQRGSRRIRGSLAQLEALHLPAAAHAGRRSFCCALPGLEMKGESNSMGVIRELRKNKWLYAMALPVVVYVFIFSYMPMSAHLLAFKQFIPVKGLWGSRWVGLDNLMFFFTGPDWLAVTLNTVYLNLLFIIAGTFFSLLIALMLNEIRLVWFKKAAQSLVILPHFISIIVVNLMVLNFFNGQDGMINRMLRDVGLETVDWFQTPSVWPLLLTVIFVWKGAGWGSIIYLATLTGFSEEYYESARIDGAKRWQQIWYITLPLLRPTIIVLTLLALGRIFYGDFGLIYGIIGDNSLLFKATDVIDTYTYRALRDVSNMNSYSNAAAVALFQSVMGFITILFFNGVVRRVDPDSKLF
ncbi:binding-protein-dependent transport systems inner membrane component [Paenibacillus mucilaginosus KNP414]|uniref:Binding-protein-dependent transport systems inner membrane component n=2 Tax=Paenibacillus mucilaginosus TaxID=61624 RepID=F8FLS4_PAEMK|nr:binding-protein-dependent transport systems inner membrane component [Paenibacillus mucilaginosus KNP414]